MNSKHNITRKLRKGTVSLMPNNFVVLFEFKLNFELHFLVVHFSDSDVEVAELAV